MIFFKTVSDTTGASLLYCTDFSLLNLFIFFSFVLFSILIILCLQRPICHVCKDIFLNMSFTFHSSGNPTQFSSASWNWSLLSHDHFTLKFKHVYYIRKLVGEILEQWLKIDTRVKHGEMVKRKVILEVVGSLRSICVLTILTCLDSIVTSGTGILNDMITWIFLLTYQLVS